jgi:uncharacterized membrane protein YhhN
MNVADLWRFGLIGAWAVLLFGGFAFGKPNADHTHRMPTWARLGSSLVLVILAWSLFLMTRENAPAALTFRLLIAVGMTLGFVGDVAMARLLPLREPVIGGIAAFGLGHIAYNAALLSMGIAHGEAWGLLLLVGAAGWYGLVFRPAAQRAAQRSALHVAALFYALLLASTAGLGVSLALQQTAFTGLAVGAILFLASDLILAAQLFAGLHFPLIGDVVWLAYGPGQLLIVLGILGAVQ